MIFYLVLLFPPIETCCVEYDGEGGDRQEPVVLVKCCKGFDDRQGGVKRGAISQNGQAVENRFCQEEQCVNAKAEHTRLRCVSIYESVKGIINAHKGFDSDGKVTDKELAIETVKDLRAKLKEIRTIVGDPGRALRQAIKAYREANRPPETIDS